MIAYFVAMVFCGIPIFYAGMLYFDTFLFSVYEYDSKFCLRFTEVALGQYLGVGGIYLLFTVFNEISYQLNIDLLYRHDVYRPNSAHHERYNALAPYIT